MNTNFSRRDFLKLTGLAGGSIILTACSSSDGERSFIDRLQGKPLTELPQIEGAWAKDGDVLTLDLAKLPELKSLGGAVRIEGEALPEPVLIVLGEDEKYYAFKNACTHSGRMIDPVAGTMTLVCCSASSSTFDYQGNVLSGPAKGSLISYPLANLEGKLNIDLH